MYKILDSKDNLLAEFTNYNEAKEYAEAKSFFMTVYFDTDRATFEYPKKEKVEKNGNK